MQNKYLKTIIARNIRFEEKSHTYWDEENNLYTSATQLINKVTPQFDTVNIAIKYAQKHGQTAQYWIEEWERIKNEACTRGNYHHDSLETGIDKINNEYWDKEAKNIGIYEMSTNTNIFNRYNRRVNYTELEHSPIRTAYPVIYARLVELIKAGWELYAEKIVYWAEFYVAGKIDLLAINPLTREFIIIDWKTNKDDLKFKSGYFKKENGIKTTIWVDKDERLKFPLDHIQHCKGNGYILQLSLYARMMENLGYSLTGIELYHIRDIGITLYTLPYWRAEVEQLALAHAGKNNKVKSDTSVPKSLFGIKK